ncbi:MAG: hypothetical protein ABSD58_10180 [Verrucomicrobiia bacterium]|jgi:hypothetical protein
MNEQQQVTVDISGASIHVIGNEGEEVAIGPTGIHVKDGDEEVNVTFSGIRIRDGHTNLTISIWKPLLACAAVTLVLVALLTAVIVGIVKLMM